MVVMYDKIGRINGKYFTQNGGYANRTSTSKSVASMPYLSVNRWRAA